MAYPSRRCCSFPEPEPGSSVFSGVDILSWGPGKLSYRLKETTGGELRVYWAAMRLL